MNKKISTQDGITIPFSDNFLDTWNLWKQYKMEAFGFKYKGLISEQMAIKHIVDLSDGEESKAVKIIEQSIRRLWQGFFPLKETTHGTATKTINVKQPKPTNDNLTDRVQSEIDKRYGGWETSGSESNLKAV